MNAGQVATSEGDILRAPDTAALEAKARRHQRVASRRRRGSNRQKRAYRRKAKAERKIARTQANWHHHVSRRLADGFGTVVVEALNTKAMTAKGGARKRGLNRVVRATGWGGLKHNLAYKANRLIEVNRPTRRNGAAGAATRRRGTAGANRDSGACGAGTPAMRTSTPH